MSKLVLTYKGWVKFTSEVDNVESVIKDYNDSVFNWFNAGIAIGAGYKLLKGEGWTKGVRYYQGADK